MSQAQRAVQRRLDLAKAREAGSELCEAVSNWVKELGGVPIEIGDLQANEISKGKYRVSVVVKGTWPKKKYELK